MFDDDDLVLTNSFDGVINEIPEISVDNFEQKTKMAYFLSHMHSDHTVGLFGNYNSSQLQSNGAKIYMSKESKTILSHNHWHYSNIEGIVETLQTELTYTIDLPDNKSFQVTLIPVKHMIGAVMFLFKTKDKTILYTGDFVMTEDEVTAVKRLHNKNWEPIVLDALYIDATFDNADYAHFPSRESAHVAIGEKAEEWLDTPDHRLALFSNYQFGYDDIYRILARRLSTKVFVSQPDSRRANTHEVYEDLYGERNFTTESTDAADSKIHICKNKNSSSSHVNCGISDLQPSKYLHVYMSAKTAYNFDPEADDQSALTRPPWDTNPTSNAYYLCYQTHCSKSQLDFFISYFKPKVTTKFPKKAVATPKSDTPYKKKKERPHDDAESVKRRLFN